MKRAVRATGWFAAGWISSVLMALFGSKLHGLVEEWRTWQGASPEKRARIRVDDERFDLWDNDLRSKQ